MMFKKGGGLYSNLVEHAYICAIALSVQLKSTMVIIAKKACTRVAEQTQHQRKLFIPVEEINILEENLSHENQMPKMVLPCQQWF